MTVVPLVLLWLMCSLNYLSGCHVGTHKHIHEQAMNSDCSPTVKKKLEKNDCYWEWIEAKRACVGVVF